MPARTVYLDNNATTPLHPEVKRAMAEALEAYGNASSLHGLGRQSRVLIEAARENLSAFFGARPDEIVFTGSGSEANNTVLNLALCSCSECGVGFGRSIVTTAIEHPCVLETARCLEKRGVELRILGVDRFGRVDPGELEGLLREKGTTLVSVMTANNEIGTVQDIPRLAEITHRYGGLFHTDAVQALGKVPVEVGEMGVDFLTLSAHKVYGPKGVGALYVRKGVPFCPMIRGGHQELGRRAGTENLLGIVGFSRAVDMLRLEWKADAARLGELRDELWKGIQSRIEGASRNGSPEFALPGTLNISFAGVEGEAILLYLDLEGIAVSTGSACSTGSLEPSHVLIAIGLPPEKAHGSIRFSLGRENTAGDIDYVLQKLPPVIARLRRMSSVYPGAKK